MSVLALYDIIVLMGSYAKIRKGFYENNENYC